MAKTLAEKKEIKHAKRNIVLLYILMAVAIIVLFYALVLGMRETIFKDFMKNYHW